MRKDDLPDPPPGMAYIVDPKHFGKSTDVYGVPVCKACGAPLEDPADAEEGYHFLCVVPTVDDVPENPEYDPDFDEGGESGC